MPIRSWSRLLARGQGANRSRTEVGLIVAAAAIVGVVILGLMGVLALFA